MSAALNLLQSNELPGMVLETLLLNHFAASGKVLHVTNSRLGQAFYYLAQAGSGNAAGFGRATNRRLACVKAIAEHFERKLMLEAFADDLKKTPLCFQTSNGFAVHFSRDAAELAATKEALERHILQTTYFRDGWSGFYQIGPDVNVDDLRIRKLVSKYRCGNYQAGIVVATSPRFAGASFGYLCEDAPLTSASPRWEHATHEAVDKIEPFLAMSANEQLGLLPISREILHWLTQPLSLDPSTEVVTSALSMPNVALKHFDLRTRWGLEFPLWGVLASGDDLMPLIIPGRFANDRNRLQALMNLHGLSNLDLARNPIL